MNRDDMIIDLAYYAERQKWQFLTIIVVVAIISALTFTAVVIYFPLPADVPDNNVAYFSITDAAGTTTTTHSTDGRTVSTITSADGKIISIVATSGRTQGRVRKLRQPRTPRAPRANR